MTVGQKPKEDELASFPVTPDPRVKAIDCLKSVNWKRNQNVARRDSQEDEREGDRAHGVAVLQVRL